MNYLHHSDFNTVTLNNYQFTGWAESNAITLPDTINLLKTQRDAAGHLTHCPTPKQGGQVILRFEPQSLSVYHLHSVLAKQKQLGYTLWQGEITFDHGRIALVHGMLTQAPLAPISRAALQYVFEFETIFYEKR